MEVIGSILFSALAMLVTLGVLVTIHEYGHFKVARLCGVQVERFSIGLGKVLYRWTGKPDPKNPAAPPTEFTLCAVPLGGYVKMVGEPGPGEPQETSVQPGAFTSKPLSSRAAIIAAGPIANFLLAIVLYWLMFVTGVSGIAPVVGRVNDDSPAAKAGIEAGDEILLVDGKSTPTWQDVRVRLLDRLGETGTVELTVGKHDAGNQRSVRIPVRDWLSGSEEPDLLGDLGMVPFHLTIPAELESVLPEGRAAAAGLLPGDRIVAANGKAIRDWNEWLKVVHDNPEQGIVTDIRRDNLPLQLTLTPAVRTSKDGSPELDAKGHTQGYIGAAVVVPKMPAWMNRSIRHDPISAIPQALRETRDNSLFVLASMKKMLTGLISLKNISGPITIAQVAGQTASYGFEYYISFLAVLSVSLGIFNLLPVPVLDGGHLLFIGMEALLRRPVPRRLQEWGLQVGLLLVAGCMFIALYNDVTRLF